MELTTFTDYSLRTLMYLAVNTDRLSSIDAISDRYQISRHHLAKVVKHLADLGYLETSRGKGGGIRLKMEPEHIPLGTLVQQTEPHLNLVECFDCRANACVLNGSCRLKSILMEAKKAFLAVLSSYTLADVIARPELVSILRAPVAV